MLPRYFVPRAGDPAPIPAPRGPLLLHVLDLFRWGERELAVVIDRSGVLHLLEPDTLPPPLVAEVHHHELLAGGRARRIDAAELWWMSVQLLEQPGDPPGLNDPVYVYGRLFGPLPADPAVPQMVDGQLAVTRGDWLDGFAKSLPHGFAVNTVPAGRCLHALLPADRAEVVEQGRALVLAYPLLAPELLVGDPGNELVVASLVYDVLAATQQDAKRSGQSHPLRSATIPVPSREDLERDLDAQGWDVRGDEAIRRSEATKKGTIGGVFAQVFGVPDAMRLTLPPEGTVDELLALAERVIPAFPGFPDRRALAVRARRSAASAPTAPPARPSPATTPRPPPPDPPPARDPSARQGPEVRRSGRDDWMGDFVRDHQRSGPSARKKKPPRLSPVERPATPDARPDWMKDFDSD